MSMSATSSNPNFPINLDIHPSFHPSLVDLGILDGNFSFDAQKLAIREYGIAGRVWEAAYAMISYIHSPDTLDFDPPFFYASTPCSTIIELGSGSGLVASIVSRMLHPGKDLFIATDLPEVCSLLEYNLSTSALRPEKSNQFPVVVKPLSWGNRAEAVGLGSAFFGNQNSTSSCRNVTHIICSDLIYFPDLFAPLLRTLLDLTSPPFTSDPTNPNSASHIFMSYKVRSLTKETPFWAAFGLWFAFRPVLVREKSGSNSDQWSRFGVNSESTTFLFVAHRRPESYHWIIPVLDHDLLSGVGANASNFPKCDDTFESLLMMMSVEHE